MTNKSLTVALIAVAIIAVIGVFTPLKTAVQNAFGGTTNYDELDASVLRVGGTNGTRLALLALSSCSLIASNYTVAASTTVPMDCAVTGVVSTDSAFAQFGTSTPSLKGWSVAGASASSTAGFITVDVANGIGASGIIPASIASSTKLIIVRGTATVPGL